MSDYTGRVEGIFNNVAKAYDEFAGKLLTLDAELLIRDLQIPENPIVLDVGCGTGLSTFALMKRFREKASFMELTSRKK